MTSAAVPCLSENHAVLLIQVETAASLAQRRLNRYTCCKGAVSPNCILDGFTSMSFTDLTLAEALTGLRAGQFSAVELTRAHLERIHALDSQLHAFITVTDELALEMARHADEQRAAGHDAPLLGIPLAIKDVLCTSGVETT